MSAGLVVHETSLLGLQMAAVLLCPHMGFSLCIYIPFSPYSCKDIIYIGLTPPLRAFFFFTLITSLKAPNTVALYIGWNNSGM